MPLMATAINNSCLQSGARLLCTLECDSSPYHRSVHEQTPQAAIFFPRLKTGPAVVARVPGEAPSSHVLQNWAVPWYLQEESEHETNVSALRRKAQKIKREIERILSTVQSA